MPAFNQNFELYQGVDKAVVFTETASVDLTGSTITWILADKPGGTTALTKSGAAITIDSAGTGVTVDIDDTDTDDLAGEYYHELLAIDGSGDKSILATGWVLIHVAQQT